MKKIILPVISIIGLLIVFGVVYSVVTSIDPQAPKPNTNTQGFSQDNQFVGAIGGVHYIRSGAITDNQNFQRLTFATQLNRSSVLEETIATPYASAELVTGDQPYIQIKLSDTTRIYAEEGTPEDVYAGVDGDTPSSAAPITKVDVLESTEEGQEIRIYLTDSSKSYRLHSDPQNPSNIWLDILK
jgi:hypothetical protein